MTPALGVGLSLGSLAVVLGAYALRARFAPERRPPTGRFTDRERARANV